ncbi:MAG: DUF4302 domain-containing protein [Bacteroides sp.]|nr:DUF4302 domain-containing protein [Bacteroides sp.]
MKKLYYLLCLMAAVMITACTHEEEDLFAQSSAERIDAAIKADWEILTGASNGWLMEYFPATQQEYGGYNMILSFGEDGQVKVASEIASPNFTLNSLYSLKQSAGVVLSFDTYNDIFHAFSDPSAPLGGNRGYGFEGDYDFLILEATAEKVTLKGKKTGGIAILTPMSGDWAEYISNVQDAEEEMAFTKYKIQIGEQEVPVSVSGRTLTFTFKEDGNEKSIMASYIVTPTGYKFYEPITVNGKELSGFTYDAENLNFKESNDATLLLIPVIPPLNEQFINHDWFIVEGMMSDAAQAMFTAGTSSVANRGFPAQYLILGNGEQLYGNFGLGMMFGGYAGSLDFQYELIDEDKIAMAMAGSAQGNGLTFFNWGLKQAMNVFNTLTGRTWQLETDNPKSPSYIKITAVDDPTIWITLLYEVTSYQ